MKGLEGKVFGTRLKQRLHSLNNIEFSQESIEKTLEMLAEGKCKRPVISNQGSIATMQIGEACDFALAEDGMIEYLIEFFSIVDIDALQYVIVFTSGGESKKKWWMRNLKGNRKRRVIDVTDIQYILVTVNPLKTRNYCLN